jgi:hypothetical protein
MGKIPQCQSPLIIMPAVTLKSLLTTHVIAMSVATKKSPPLNVIPAKAGIQNNYSRGWIPVFTGMTVIFGGFKGGEAPFYIKGRRAGKDIKQGGGMGREV